MCPYCDGFVCHWRRFYKLGLLCGSGGQENESQRGSEIWFGKVFHGFLLWWLWRDMELQLLKKITVKNNSKSGSYPGQVFVLWKLKYLYLYFYLDWNPQPFPILFHHFQQLH